jgi:hypothetical protein
LAEFVSPVRTGQNIAGRYASTAPPLPKEKRYVKRNSCGRSDSITGMDEAFMF